jgi:hypothetical protein
MFCQPTIPDIQALLDALAKITDILSFQARRNDG